MECVHAGSGCTWRSDSSILKSPAEQLTSHVSVCPYEALSGYIAEKNAEIAELRTAVAKLEATLALNSPENLMPCHTLSSHTACVVSLAMYNTLLLSGSMDGTLKVWTTSPSAPFVISQELQLGPTFQMKLVGSRMHTAHENSVKVWDFSLASQLIATLPHNVCVKALYVLDNLLFSGTVNGDILVWNLTTFQPIRTIAGAHKGDIREITVSKRTGMLWTTGDDGYVRVWNSVFECVKEFRAHKGPIRVMTFVNLDSGELLMTGSDDTYIRLWDVTNFSNRGIVACMHQVCCFTGVAALTILQNATKVTLTSSSSTKTVCEFVSGHTDGTIRWWSLEIARNVQMVKKHLLTLHTDAVRALIPYGTGFISGSYDNTIKVCPFPQKKP